MTKLRENIVIIKINKSYREGISETELYDVSRGCWKRKIASVDPYSDSFSVHFSFFTYFSDFVIFHIPGPSVCISHFSRILVIS